jgi:hypothetical protein
MNLFNRILLLVVPPLLSAGLAGCSGGGKDGGGGKPFIVKGKLVDNGRPFALDESKVPLPKGGHGVPPGITGSSTLQVTFIAAETKEQFSANANADAGTFEVKGPDGKGIKPGRYRIAVTAQLGFGPDTPDYFKGMFTQEKTQILRDIKEGEEVVIDVAKPQG